MRLLRRLLPLLALAAPAVAAAAPPRPNVVVILTDDMGYSDLGCYGGEIATPNLDALAAGGLRFTQFYNATRCCPTRAALLTGLYPHQAGMGFMVRKIDHPGYAGDLSRSAVTLAEVLRSAGYHTAMAGKWHVSLSHHPRDGTASWPVQRGFDRFYGTLRGFGSFHDPDTLCRQNTFVSPAADPEYQPPAYYYTDAINDHAIRYVREAPRDRPFFLYVAHTAAHWPLQAPAEEVAKYRGRYDAGYDAIRRARLARLRALGLFPPDAPAAPTIGRWAEVADPAWEARGMEVYAAMIDRMDQGIGRLMEELRRTGRAENTLTLYLHDNGACAERQGRDSPAGKAARAPADLRPLRPEELQTRATPPMQTRDGRPVRSGPGVMPGPEDTYVGYGEAWANVANTPFREYKHWVHEGGIATPLIAHWPAGIPAARRGGLEREPGHVIDLMATVVDLAGTPYPREFAGQAIKPPEGRSLVPLLTAAPGAPARPDRPLFWEHESNRAMRLGRWKLVAMADQPWELYDLETDPAELRDLAAAEPARVREMAAAWDDWARRADVLPLGSWKPAYRTPGK
jgi:arylsulfatase